jgi:hypothetical protein
MSAEKGRMTTAVAEPDVKKDVKEAKERKETKAEAVKRKKQIAENLEAIEPLVNSLWYEAKYRTIPMFVVYFTGNEHDRSKLDPHFENYGLEEFDGKLQKAVLEMLNGHPLVYTLVAPERTWAEVPEALKQSLQSASYGLEPTAIDGVISQVCKDATNFRGTQPLQVLGLWEAQNENKACIRVGFGARYWEFDRAGNLVKSGKNLSIAQL